MKKKLLSFLLAALLVFPFALIACDDEPEPKKPPTLETFTVAASISGQQFEDVTVPAAEAVDTEGTKYNATVVVTDADGKSVTVTDGKFRALKAGDSAYVMTYTVTISDVKTTKQTTVNVAASATVSSFEVAAFRKALVGLPYVIERPYAVLTDGTKLHATYTVKKGETALTPVNDAFTPDAEADYVISYTVTHKSIENGSLTKTMTVRAVLEDEDAPIITMPKNGVLTAAVWDYAALKAQIAVTDEIDRNPTITIELFDGSTKLTPADESAVAVTYGHTYTVTVSASDASENVATAKVQFVAVDSAAVTAATKMYDVAAFQASDLTVTKGTATGEAVKGTEHAIAGLYADTVKIGVEGKTSVAFNTLAANFIDDHAYAEFAVYVDQDMTATFYGTGHEVSLQAGYNVVRFSRDDFAKAFYDRTGVDTSKPTDGFYNHFHQNANIASNDGGAFRIEFTDAVGAANVWIAGLYASKDGLTRTDMIDLKTATKLGDYFTDDGSNAKRGLALTLADSSVFAGAKAAKHYFDGVNVGAESKPANYYKPYTYINNDVTNRADNKISLQTFDYVSFVFNFDVEKFYGDEGTVKIRLSDSNYYAYLKPGINVITLPKSEFKGTTGANSYISANGESIHTGIYAFYFYTDYSTHYNASVKAGEAAPFTVTLEALYGLAAQA